MDIHIPLPDHIPTWVICTVGTLLSIIAYGLLSVLAARILIWGGWAHINPAGEQLPVDAAIIFWPALLPLFLLFTLFCLLTYPAYCLYCWIMPQKKG